jgi:hypothetical protein
MPPIKVDRPPPPTSTSRTRRKKYPTGEMSIYGLRKKMSAYLDKDVQVKAYLLQIYECPAEQRKCNDDLAAKSKKEKKKELKNLKAGKETAAAPPRAASRRRWWAAAVPAISPTSSWATRATTKMDHGLLWPTTRSRTGTPASRSRSWPRLASSTS